jgi:predicted porin
MKKLLIASAALAMVAGTAQAQSSVTVYGLLDIGFSDSSIKNTAVAGTTKEVSRRSTGNGDGGLATSRLGFRGTEDLGGGNKANFVLEYDLLDSGSQGTSISHSTSKTALNNSGAESAAASLGARYSWVGLESAKLGQLRLGRQEASVHSVVVAGSAGGANNTTGALYSAGGPDNLAAMNAPASPAANNVTAVGVRPHDVFINKAVTYISPNFSGVTFELQTAQLKDEYTATDVATNVTADRKVNGASLKYSAGKLALAYGLQQVKYSTLVATESAKKDVNVFSGSYDLGVAKVFAIHSQREDDATANFASTKAKNTEVGVQVPLGKTVLWASMVDGDSKATTVTSGVYAQTNADTSGYQLGARYDLSKRTAVYAIYGKQDFKGTTLNNLGSKNEASQLAAGVRHSF